MFGSSDNSDDPIGNGKDDVSAPTDINTRGVGTSTVAELYSSLSQRKT